MDQLQRTAYPQRALAWANVRPRRSCVKQRSLRIAPANRLTCCCSGSSENGLTRSQIGRRKRSARKTPVPSVLALRPDDPWTPDVSTHSRSVWLEDLKQQPTEVLFAALLGPAAVPEQRLPVLLAVLEGRPDLEACVAAVDAAGAATAVLRSSILQRLLPGGALHDLLLRLLEHRAPDLTCGDLLVAARLVAAWPPPASAESLSAAAAAVAGAVMRFVAGAGGRGSGTRTAETAADVAALAESLTLLRPWLVWLSSREHWTADDGAEASAAECETDDAAGVGAVLASAREAVARLLGWLETARPAAAADPSVLGAVFAAASCYDVEVPSSVARAAVSLAETASTSGTPDDAHVALELAAQLVVTRAAQVRRGRSSSSNALTDDVVYALAANRLDARSDAKLQSTFLRLLLHHMRQQREQEQEQEQERRSELEQDSGARGASATATTADSPVLVARGVESQPYAGLLRALGASAGDLGCSTIQLGMECAAEAAAVGAADDSAAVEAARQLLAAVRALVATPQQWQASEHSADRLCQLATAALRLRDVAGCSDPQASAAVGDLLASIDAAALRGASAGALARLLAAVAAMGAARDSRAGATVDDQVALDGDGEQRLGADASLPLHVRLRGMLLDQLAAAASQPPAPDEAEDVGAEKAPDTPPTAGSGAPWLSYDEAVAVLTAVVATAEGAAAAVAVASTSTSTATLHAALPQQRAASLRAAGLVAARAMAPAVHRLDAPSATRLLQLLARADRAGVRPDHPQLMWALHERLRALAPSMPPAGVLAVLRGCLALRWRPGVLVRELLLPLVLELQEAGDAGLRRDQEQEEGREGEPGPAGPARRGEWQRDMRDADSGSIEWTAGEVREVLVLLAAQAHSGPLVAAVVKLGVGALLRHRGPGGSLLAPTDLSTLLWVCVATRYRGAAVLRPLMQRLLQFPPEQVPVRAAAQAVWAAARLGVVGSRLERWAVRACMDASKLGAAPPQSLANLCSGLAKLVEKGEPPPKEFSRAVLAACIQQLPGFGMQELSAALFVLANWGARVGSADEAAALVAHVVASRRTWDGPALCNAAWALQRLTAGPAAHRQPPGDLDASSSADGSGSVDDTPSGAVAAPVDAAALAALEDRLLELMAPPEPQAAASIPDHYLYRFFAACAAADTAGGGRHRPDRLAAAYAAVLRARLPGLVFCPADAAARAYRSRQLWAISQSLLTLGLRDPGLLAGLEAAAVSCQAVLRPRHLAGLLNAMAALGHFPARFAGRGLLRRVGLALRSADAREAGLLLEALATWRLRLHEAGTAAASGPVPAHRARQESRSPGKAVQAQVAGSDPGVGGSAGPAAEQAEGGPQQQQQQGNGWAAAGEGEQEQDASGEGSEPVRNPSPQRLDLLRRVALARLTQLCVPAQLQPSRLPPPAESISPAAPPPLRENSSPGAAPGSAATTSSSDGVSPPSLPSPATLGEAAAAAGSLPTPSGPAASSPAPAPVLGVDDALRLLKSLAKLRWQCGPVEAELVRAAAAVAVERRHRVPELTTLLWALASVRHDDPGLMDDLQAALLGQRRQQSLAEEVAMLEAGQAGALTEAPTAPGTAAAAGSAAPLPVPAAQVPAAPATAEGTTSSAPADPSPTASSQTQSRPSSHTGDGEEEAALDRSQDGRASVPGTVSTAAAPGEASSSGLLARPVKPAAPPGASVGPGRSSAPFDPAAAMAAAAQAAAQALDAHLDQPTGRGQLPTEPWRPADVYKALWACAKMNRHPGPHMLAAAERSWFRYTDGPAADDGARSGGGGGGGGSPSSESEARPPLHAVTGLLWALAVFRHHNGSFAERLAAQLAERLRGPEEAAAFARQALQLAACLLAAQADRSDSPLNTALPPEARARLVAAWRDRLAARRARPPNRYQADLVSVLRKMGLTAAANVATPDGCAVVDVAVALMGAATVSNAGVAPRLLALELIGRHNSAANSPRIMGESVLKYRLLQARGYMVVPILCHEWDRISHQDVWTKMVYLQAKIDRRTRSGTAGGAVAPAVRPLVEAVGPQGSV